MMEGEMGKDLEEWAQQLKNCSIEDLQMINFLLDTDSKIDPALLEGLEDEEPQRAVWKKADKSVFVTPQVTQGWREDAPDRSYVISKFIKYCAEALKKNKWQPYRFKKLPMPSKYLKVRAGDVGKCEIVCVRNPWDFHVIFESSFLVDYNFENGDWMGPFQKRDVADAEFQNPLQLFHTMSQLLQTFLEYYDENKRSLAVPKEIKMKCGDLVIVSLARDSTETLVTSGAIESGYRGVILDDPICKELRNEDKAKVYLLDTGEVMEIIKACLVPLPRSFTGFSPMAVRLALHGLSPIGPEWSFAGCERMCELAKPQPGKKIFAEFYDRSLPTNKNVKKKTKPKLNQCEPTGDSLSSSPPLFVELRFMVEEKQKTGGSKASSKNVATNVSSLLIKEHLGIEWSLIPFQRQLRLPATQEEKDKKSIKKPERKGVLKGIEEIPLPSLSRDVALHFITGSPCQVITMEEKDLEREMLRVFCNDPEMAPEFIHKESNILSLSVKGNPEVKTPSILPLFRPT